MAVGRVLTWKIVSRHPLMAVVLQEKHLHPQTFLKTFWRLEMRPTVFVAMSFAPQYQTRFDAVLAPCPSGRPAISNFVAAEAI
jgi:hypothetical protein